MSGLISSFVLALLIGLAVVTLLWPRRRLQADLLTKIALATGLGFGVTSCLSFLLLAATRGHLTFLPAAELVVLAILVTWAVVRHSSEEPGLACLKETGRWKRAAPAAALAVFLLGAATFALDSACWPHGDWDAWSIWNLHARFLYQGGAQWAAFFAAPLGWSHPDYPLLLPVSIMRAWVFAGGEAIAGPIGIAFVFMAGICLLLYSGLALLRGRRRACLAAIVLVATPLFIRRAATQYADVPLAFFYLAALVLLCLADGEGRRGLLTLAGLACGMAAWTKNEGMLFTACILLASLWTSARAGGLRACWSRMRPFLAGLLPVVLVILFFKFRYAPPNDIVGSAARASAVEKVLTPARYAAIGEWFLKQLFVFGQWDELRCFPVSPVPLLLGALVLLGIRPEAKKAQGLTTAAWTLGLTLAGYLAMVLISPNAPEWELSRAGARLLLQLWPSALFVFFMVLRDPISDRACDLHQDAIP